MCMRHVSVSSDSRRRVLTPPGSPAARLLRAPLEAEWQSLLSALQWQEAPEDRLELRTARLPGAQPRQPESTEMGKKALTGLPARSGCHTVAALVMWRSDTC